jgi:hypothetical protein
MTIVLKSILKKKGFKQQFLIKVYKTTKNIK